MLAPHLNSHLNRPNLLINNYFMKSAKNYACEKERVREPEKLD